MSVGWGSRHLLLCSSSVQSESKKNVVVNESCANRSLILRLLSVQSGREERRFQRRGQHLHMHLDRMSIKALGKMDN